MVARRVPRDGRFAEQRSRDLGHGTDFCDFRPYSPGDDFRSIDWNIYQRLGRVFLRPYEELEDLPLYLIPDVSRSMFLESPPRARAGLRTTLALASITRFPICSHSRSPRWSGWPSPGRSGRSEEHTSELQSQR